MGVSLRATALLLFAAFGSLLNAQAFNPWTQVRNDDRVQVQQPGSRLYIVDQDALQYYLLHADTFQLALPLPDGNTHSFTVWAYDIMEPGLSNKFPGWKSYTGYSDEHPQTTCRLSWTPLGFHAVISHGNTFYLVDPARTEDREYYVSYRAADLASPSFECFTTDRDTPSIPGTRNGFTPGKSLRIFRLAIAATGEYTQFHGGTVESALAAILTSVNRINFIFEKETSTRFIIVNQNDQLIFTNPETDPFGNSGLFKMINANQELIDQVVGNDNYDIGHVFGTYGGGMAITGGACESGEKARAGTGLSFPAGDFFDVVYVCHEIGHQLNAVHTFNSCRGMGGPPHGYEPGSGTTIMAYAGLCYDQDIQPNTDFFFHSSSCERIIAHGNDCASITPLANEPPIILNDFSETVYIPVYTPLRLKGDFTDPDENPVLISWDEMDVGPIAPLGEPEDNAPLFRFRPPESSGIRFLPAFDDLWHERSTPSEVLPFYNRDISFRMVARDVLPEGGGVSYKDLQLKSVVSAGPFRVYEPKPESTWTIGETGVVKWNVAGTDLPPVSCSTVSISLVQADGIIIPLGENFANSGSAEVDLSHMPEIDSCRVMVSAENNYFFAWSDQINIVRTPPGFDWVVPAKTFEVCREEPFTLEFDLYPVGDYDGTVIFAFDDVPDSATIQAIDIPVILPGTAIFSVQFTDVAPGEHTMTVHAFSEHNALQDSLTFQVNQAPDRVFPEHPDVFALNLEQESLSLRWNGVEGAEGYEVQIAQSEDFNTELSVHYSTEETLHSQLSGGWYYWRVRGENYCGYGPWGEVRMFHVAPEGVLPPVFVNRDTLVVLAGVNTIISSDSLLLESPSNEPEDLIYFLHSVPKNGIILLDNSLIGNDSSFSQKDINDYRVVLYMDRLDAGYLDGFVVSIMNKEGGLLAYQEIIVRVVQNVISAEAVILENLQCHNEQGGVIEVLVTNGSPPFRFRINENNLSNGSVFYNLGGGNYTFEVQDRYGFSAISQEVSLVNPDSFYIEIYNDEDWVYVNEFGGTPPFVFSVDGGPWQPDPAFQGLDGGIHFVQSKDNNGCLASGEIELPFTTGTEIQSGSLESIKLMPNPARNRVEIKCSGEIRVVHFFTINGQWARSVIPDYSTNHSLFLNIQGLASGVYLVQIESDSGIVFKKLVVEK